MNYVEYNGLKLRLNAERIIELESKLGKAINKAFLEDSDKLGTAVCFVASALEYGNYEERKKTAYELYDGMLAEGKGMPEYQQLLIDLLVSAGFMTGKAAETLKKIMNGKAALANVSEVTQN